MTNDEKRSVIAEMQQEWLNFCRTGNVRHCHIITARLNLLTWEWSNGLTPVTAADLADSDVIKEAAE